MESKKQNKTKQKQTFGYREMVVARGDVGGRTAKIDDGIKRYKLPVIK